MTDIEQLISQLNDEQVKPVLDTDGYVLVIAGAGSGKTRVLTTRIAYLVLKKNVNSSRIMAITFTNKAAGEMKDRLLNIVGDLSDMWVSTIHSMCVRILRSNIDKIGYDKNFTIYDDTDKDKVLKRVFEDLSLDADKYLKSFKNRISMAKNDCLNPEEYAKANQDLRFIDDFTKVYSLYENRLAGSNSLDFDDLLVKTYELFNTHPEVADYYSDKFEYVHIDEFQDTNKVQFEIAKRLAYKHGNLFAVGDDDQSIYGWRGADISNILSFDDIFSNAKVYKLQRNYRSTKKILNLANCIIKNNTSRRDKELWTENEEGVKVETYIAPNETSEAQYVAIQIKNIMARTNLRYKDFAVFMRLNALSRAFEQEFMKYGIPNMVYGGFRFFERKEIKGILAYLKLVNNKYDDESFLRAVSTPRRGIGDKTLKELREYTSSRGISLYDGLSSLDMTSIGSSAKIKLFNFKLLIDSIFVYSNSNSVADTITFLLDSTSFMSQFEEKTEENSNKKMNISELVNSAVQFAQDNPDTNLADYLNSVTLSSDTDSLDKDDVVTIATIHASKGLEYKCVFVVGLDENILPVIRNSEEEDLEEERRLMYVAITRAMERLYLTRAMSRYMYGKREYMTQSRFLKEGQPALSVKTESDNTYKFKTTRDDTYYYRSFDETSDSDSSAGYSSSYAKSMLNSNKPVAKSNVQYSKFFCGVKVKHTKYGEGIVVSVKGEGENIIVDVSFKGVGLKSLAAKYAPMEIV